jgi:cyclopropane-fatty-acyl-phospholipid synthase
MTATETPTGTATATPDVTAEASLPPAAVRRAGLSARATTAPATHARRLHGAFSRVLGTRDWQLITWDGAVAGTPGAAFTLTFRSLRALDRLVGSLPDRAFGRAYATGELDVEPLSRFLAIIGRRTLGEMALAWPRVLAAGFASGARPDRQPIGESEANLHGRRHSPQRDRAAIAHHYDLPAEFYGLFLDSLLTYSCAYFATPDDDLDSAQRAKLDLICRKLRLRSGERLLDVGCGFGGLVLHAAESYGVRCLGITLSTTQADWARRQIAARGLQDRVEVRIADYRDDLGAPFDAVASVGMVEHVGERQLAGFAKDLYRCVGRRGRLLLHGITRRPDVAIVRGSFTDRFVFPDGEVPEAGAMVTHLQEAGFEVRDLEDLREHYVLTLDRWVGRLESRMDAAVRIAGGARARIWRLYLAGAAWGFREDRLRLHQALAVRPDGDGRSGIPLRREDWYR